MQNPLKTIGNVSLAVVGLFAAACNKPTSNITGMNYNDPKNGGFDVVDYDEQETGPGLVLIEGGTFTMGAAEQDVMFDWNSIPRRITVSSFYMDETEISNLNYREYLYWINRVYGSEYPEVCKKALPDTLVWGDKLAYNDPLMAYYFRHPAYQDYPVVGVSWLQANDFCTWRTDRVNEQILVREGILEFAPGNDAASNNFNTDAYLAGLYTGVVKNGLPDYKTGEKRPVRMEDGIVLPQYRLPTEAEWEFAAYSLVGNTDYERITDRKLYPWNGHFVRNAEDKNIGKMMANFKRGRGDNMGIAGNLNDNADITAPVYSYWPNDYGLYNMAGNVSEWVMDVYRPLTNEDKSDFRSFRGNVFKTAVKDEDGAMELDSLGRVKYRNLDYDKDNLAERTNFRKADNINYLDGDVESQARRDWLRDSSQVSEEAESNGMYDYGITSMINDKARVYKGGSWKDRAYWMNPGARRFLDQKKSTDYIGFRCAMARVGSPSGLGKKKK